MANKIITTIIITLVTSIVSAPVVDHIKELVASVANLSITGDEKRKIVRENLRVLKGDLGAAVSGLSGALVNLAIEAVVAWGNARK